MLIKIILANLLVGLCGVLGAFGVIKFFARHRSRMILLVSFAAGSMIAVSFLDLLPEAVAAHGNLNLMIKFLMLGFILFLLMEKAMIYYHCHEENCRLHSSVKLVMLGDSLHNFLDGVAVAASFVAGPTIGFLTTLAIIIHEIPQEIGDFGVLLHAGFSRKRALLFNIISGFTAILGGVLAYFALNRLSFLMPYFLALTAGGFIYVAAADLLPETHHDLTTRREIFLHSLLVIMGMAIIWLLGKYIGEN
ncbi:MAG: ZIP family metal transporter [Candidatus Magasanikbacteria bacterium]|nr:ZIP family metal transporter [Candidatus Magasanikbacteria bacterium]